MRRESDTRSGDLRARVLSAVVLAPLALGAVWAGEPWFEMMIGLTTALGGWEWCRMSRLTALVPMTLVVLAGPVAVTGALVVGPNTGLGTAAAMALLALFASLVCRRRAWGGVGVVYLAVPAVSAVWLREDVLSGQFVVLWLLSVVWTTDIAAYAIGRSLGGARLVPRLSPRKTWSGLTGGVVTAGFVGYGLGFALGVASPVILGVLGAITGVVSQGGDIAESAVKRRVGVKDSGFLIPGHGGVLDRIDGLLTAIVLVAGLTWLSGGILPGWQ